MQYLVAVVVVVVVVVAVAQNTTARPSQRYLGDDWPRRRRARSMPEWFTLKA